MYCCLCISCFQSLFSHSKIASEQRSSWGRIHFCPIRQHNLNSKWTGHAPLSVTWNTNRGQGVLPYRSTLLTVQRKKVCNRARIKLTPLNFLLVPAPTLGSLCEFWSHYEAFHWKLKSMLFLLLHREEMSIDGVIHIWYSPGDWSKSSWDLKGHLYVLCFSPAKGDL